MCHLPPGISGLLVGLGTFLVIWPCVYVTRKSPPYDMDPEGKTGAFEFFLAKYIRASEFIITLATGSIVLLVGSFALHGQTGRLPGFYASPLLLLACCVVYGIAFIIWLIYHYEEYRQTNRYTRFAYSTSLTFGFSALACFWVGYIWLILRVTG
jgi:hypothetical protein